MGFEPQRSRRVGRIYTHRVPPRNFVAAAVHLAVMPSTQWNGELIADLSPESSALREPEMMSIRGAPTANQTGLLGNKLDVLPIADPSGLGTDQRAFINRRFNALPCVQLGYAPVM
jgi:hypothetical protein